MGDAPPHVPEAKVGGRLLACLLGGKSNFMTQYTHSCERETRTESLLSGSNRRPAAYKAAALAI